MSNEKTVKPANLGRFSSFIEVSKNHLKIPKAGKRQFSICSMTVGPMTNDEMYARALSIKNRLDAVRAECEKRKLKFIAQKFGLSAIEKALVDVENELGIIPNKECN